MGRRFESCRARFLRHILRTSERVRGNRPQLRRSPRPVGTYQLKYFSQFLATALGVAPETFRAWDGGRRTAPEAIVSQTRTLKAKSPQKDRVPLQVLASELHVHVRTLRAAAHDGRLAATFGPRPYFGKITATATREAGARFMATWYRRTYGRGRRRPVAVCRVLVPDNYAAMLVGLRSRLGLSQWTGHRGRGGEQGRGLSMGDSKAEALTCVLAAARALAASVENC